MILCASRSWLVSEACRPFVHQNYFLVLSCACIILCSHTVVTQCSNVWSLQLSSSTMGGGICILWI